MSEEIYLMTLGLVLGTILFVFGMRYVSAVLQARTRAGAEGGWRQLAESAAASQAETSTRLASLSASVQELGARLAAIETILKAVE